MTHPNLDLINQFFEAYASHDREAIRKVVAEDARWTFPGRHPLGGTKVGLDEVVAFFDRMGEVMGKSNVKAERLVAGANDDYVVECQHLRTQRADRHNLDQELCVLWKFKDGRLTEGRHFAADQQALDDFFTRLMSP